MAQCSLLGTSVKWIFQNAKLEGKKVNLKPLKHHRFKSFKSEVLKKRPLEEHPPPDFLLYLLYLNIDREELTLAEVNMWLPTVGVLVP